MLSKLILLFIIVPAVELILLIEIGQIIGTIPTIALIVFTGILGAFLARRQGSQVLHRLRTETQAGQLPADALSDGIFVLIAGAVLMTPGVLTDIFGFLCLIPLTRRLIKQAIWSHIQRAIQNGRLITVTQWGASGQPARPKNIADDVVIFDADDLDKR